MKISGFSFVRNGFDYGVPFLESLQSILPVCDEFIMVVGNSNDGTREAIEALQSNKIKIIDTVWDMNLKKGGKIFAQQTNIGIDAASGNWCFHIQADEVIHENDLPKIKQAIEQNDDNKNVDGFILPFLHFWGGYNYIRNTRRIHKHEVRIFRNGIGVRSYRDSQGFRKFSSINNYNNGKEPGEKLHVKKIDAPIFHYNGIRPPAAFRKKAEQMGFFYKTEEQVAQELDAKKYDWDNVDRVEPFTGKHPALMQPKADAQDWTYIYNPAKAVWKTKDRIMQPIEDILGFKFGEYRNYKLVK
ncbi:MAG: glycosyltransferase [Sphingobacteriia bacterium]|nr:glycosyltransferase [Sphingobacteriia bacterium]